MPRILYVEDNDDNIYMLSRRLGRLGFDVMVARDGAAGIEMARAELPDLILMDLTLPVMNGWEAATRLKGDDTTRAIPIIALSAHVMEGERERALTAGCDDYDTKPVELDRLVGKIAALLEVAGSP